MLLTLDIGNTTIAYGVFVGEKLVKSGRAAAVGELPLSKFSKIDKVVVSSVVPNAEGAVRRLVEETLSLEPIFIAHKNIDLKIALKNKGEIGVDRLVNALAASKLYGLPVIIIDFGTATTFCAVSVDGTYQGGAIAPGINLSRESLHEKTAKLPLINLKETKKAVGKSTVEAMESGIYIGYVGLVKELLERFKQEIGEARVVATGGYAKLLSKALKFDIIDEHLTLKGLRFVVDDMEMA